MYARMTELRGITDTDSDLQHFEGEILPKVEGIPGMSGGMVLVDRDEGSAIVITLWEDAETLADSREEVNSLRELAFQRMNLTKPAVVREFEVGVARLDRIVERAPVG